MKKTLLSLILVFGVLQIGLQCPSINLPPATISSWRFSFDIPNSIFYFENVGDTSGFYSYSGIDFSKYRLSLHFWNNLGYSIIEPSPQAAGYQNSNPYPIVGNKISQTNSNDQFIMGSTLNQLSTIRSFTYTIQGKNTCIGTCISAANACRDFCPHKGFIVAGAKCNSYTKSCYPCDCGCSSGCYGPGKGLCCHASCSKCSGPSNTACSACTPGHYLEGSTCNKCNPSCATCSGSSNTQCNSCASGNFLQPDRTTCLSTCPTGYYKNSASNTCDKCHSACASCTGPTINDCLTCNAGYNFLSSSNTCVTTCPTGYYSDTTSKTCYKCDASCHSCSGPSSKECTACSTGSFLHSNACLLSCPNGYYAKTDSNTCGVCDSSCQSCSGPSDTQCISCDKGYFLQPTPNSNTCLHSCPTGYYGNTTTNTCDLCDSTCAACTSSGNKDCLICNEGYYLQPAPNSNTCLTTCPIGYWLNKDRNTCNECHPLCHSCFGPSHTQCDSCTKGFVFQVAPNSKACLNTCPIGYYINTATNTCDQCHSACGACIGSCIHTCLTCNKGYYLQPAPNSNSCLTTCPIGYSPNPASNTCTL